MPAQNSDNAKKPSTSSTASESDVAVQPLTGITNFNYVQYATAFMRANGGRGFVIVRDGNVHVHQSRPGQYSPSMREWGAWRAWYKSKNLRWLTMDRLGYATVPTRWPHEFDAEWPEHHSVDAANRWQDRVEAEQAKEKQRNIKTEKGKEMVKAWREGRRLPPVEEPPQKGFEFKTPAAPPSDELKRLLEGSEGL